MRYRDRILRHELKYIISQEVYEILRARFCACMKPDSNAEGGGYRVTSLYFDDIYRSSYNDKISGTETRRKFRLRAYNLSTKKITLESKHKDGEYVSKKNADLTTDEYYRLIGGGYSMGFEDKFAKTSMESLAASNSITLLHPSVLVDYFREAYVCEAGNVRLTFDKALSTCYTTLDMFSPDAVFSRVLGNNIILEIKYDEFLPSYIESIISGFPLTRESVSKFVICADKMTDMHIPV